MKKIQLFIFSLLILLQPQLLAVLNETEQIYPVGSIITQEEFLTRFEKIDGIDSGGESEVFEVLEKQTNKKYALVIARGYDDAYYYVSNDDETRKNTIAFAKRMLEVQKYNPHQAIIHACFWIKRKSVYSVGNLSFDAKKYRVRAFTPLSTDKLMNELSEDEVNSNEFQSIPEKLKYGVVHLCYLLELGDNDLASKEYKSFNINNDLEKLITFLSENFIQHANIYSTDFKIRNHIYLKSENVFYDDRAMSDYQYWHYHFDNNHFYIPALPVVIKRIDYGGWHLIKSRKESPTYCNLAPYSMYNEKPLVPDDQILDILTYIPE